MKDLLSSVARGFGKALARVKGSGHAGREPSSLSPAVDISTTAVSLRSTMEYLGDATSRNLEFSYRPDVPASYGEETITESNLLELRRRHSDVVQLRTLTKHQESRLGGDWEWYIVGRKRTLRMRVQAKRVTSNDVLRIRHTVGGSGVQQRELLIQSAQADRMRPMYCIYCTNPQRSLWRQRWGTQTGCLLADARQVPLDTRSLGPIEHACWPWQFLLEDATLPDIIEYYVPREGYDQTEYEFPAPPPQPLRWDAPRILDLNEDTEWPYDRTGVEDTAPLDLAMVADDGGEELRRTAGDDLKRRLDEGVHRIVAIDVRSLEPELRIL